MLSILLAVMVVAPSNLEPTAETYSRMASVPLTEAQLDGISDGAYGAAWMIVGAAGFLTTSATTVYLIASSKVSKESAFVAAAPGLVSSTLWFIVGTYYRARAEEKLGAPKPEKPKTKPPSFG